MVDLHDTLILDRKARRLSTGELVASVRCARTGLQDYAGHEVGKPDLARVTVYRPEAEVMKRDSFATFAGAPVTIDHPSEAVTTDNWKLYAVGEAGDEVVRDGEFIRVPILVRDESAIRAIEDGKRQISMGYSCSLEFVDGLTADGKPYQAIQRNIRINHLAVVDRARGGEALVVDDQRVDGRTYSADGFDDKTAHQRRETVDNGVGQMATKTIIVDGLQVETTDAGEAAILKLQGQVQAITADKATADKSVGELTATISTKDGEITALKQQVEDAKVSPAKLQQLVADRAALIDTATKIVPAIVTDGKTDVEIRKEVVAAKLGDAAKDFDDNHVAGAFGALAATVTTTDADIDPVRSAIIATPVNVADAATAYDAAVEKRKNSLRTAYLGAPANAA